MNYALNNTVQIDQHSVPWYTTNPDYQSLPQIVFSPANGIPWRSYRCFFDLFQNQYSICGIDSRGAWPQELDPPRKFHWNQYADDLITLIESKHNEPVIGMGHSLGGAITLLAAKKRPELFSKLVLIDPASLPSAHFDHFFRLLPQWFVFATLDWVKRTHHRQRIWESPQAFCDNYRDHSTYKRFTDQALSDYAQYGLRETESGQFELIFNPHWESLNFRKVMYLWNLLKGIEQPTLLLRAEFTNLYSQKQFDHNNQKLSKNIVPQVIEGAHHLVTHEKPEKISNQILKWLK